MPLHHNLVDAIDRNTLIFARESWYKSDHSVCSFQIYKSIETGYHLRKAMCYFFFQHACEVTSAWHTPQENYMFFLLIPFGRHISLFTSIYWGESNLQQFEWGQQPFPTAIFWIICLKIVFLSLVTSTSIIPLTYKTISAHSRLLPYGVNLFPCTLSACPQRTSSFFCL